MSLFTIFAIAIGLCMDTVSVSIAAGYDKKQLTFKNIVRFAVMLALFQTMMPFIGWFLGETVIHLIDVFDHWVAFLLLGIIGGKMAYDGIFSRSGEKSPSISSLRVVLLLAIATSIDALAVGFTFSTLHEVIWLPLLVIGLTTFLCALLGIGIGYWIGHRFQSLAQVIGGVILIGIGVKILVEHLKI